jgi:hypothetical protein
MHHFHAHTCHLGPALCFSLMQVQRRHISLPHTGAERPHLPPLCCSRLRAQPALRSFPPSCCCSLRSISVVAPSGSAAAATTDVPSSARFGGHEIGGSCMAFLVDSLFFSVLRPVSLDLSLLLARCRRLALCRQLSNALKTLLTSNTRFTEQSTLYPLTVSTETNTEICGPVFVQRKRGGTQQDEKTSQHCTVDSLNGK